MGQRITRAKAKVPGGSHPWTRACDLSKKGYAGNFSEILTAYAVAIRVRIH